jgi:hypothetical protein
MMPWRGKEGGGRDSLSDHYDDGVSKLCFLFTVSMPAGEMAVEACERRRWAETPGDASLRCLRTTDTPGSQFFGRR